MAHNCGDYTEDYYQPFEGIINIGIRHEEPTPFVRWFSTLMLFHKNIIKYEELASKDPHNILGTLPHRITRHQRYYSLGFKIIKRSRMEDFAPLPTGVLTSPELTVMIRSFLETRNRLRWISVTR